MKTRMKQMALVLLVLFFFTACNNAKQDSDVIKIGAILPITGPASSAGVDSRDGLILACEQANADSSSKLKFNLLIEDSKALAKEGVTAINKLNLAEKPEIIYSQLSSVSIAIKPIAEKNKQILLAVSGANDLIDTARTTYRNYINPKYYASKTVQILKDTLKVNNIGIFYSNNDFGLSIMRNIENELIQNDIQISFKESYDDQSDNFRTLTTKNIQKNGDLKNIYVIGVGKSLGILIKQIKDLKYSSNIIGGIEIPYPDVTNIIGNDVDNIYYIDFGFDSRNPKPYSVEFIKDFKQKFNRIPTTSSAIAYDALNLYFNAVTLGKSKDIDLNELSFPYQGVSGQIYVKKNEFYYELSLKRLGNAIK